MAGGGPETYLGTVFLAGWSVSACSFRCVSSSAALLKPILTLLSRARMLDYSCWLSSFSRPPHLSSVFFAVSLAWLPFSVSDFSFERAGQEYLEGEAGRYGERKETQSVPRSSFIFALRFSASRACLPFTFSQLCFGGTRRTGETRKKGKRIKGKERE